MDDDIEISLKEYGILWIDDPNYSEILFYYGININGEEYNKFDFCIFHRDMDVTQEFDWADFTGMLDTNDITMACFRKLPLQSQICYMNWYYGYENIFGLSYFEGFEYEFITGEK